MFNIVKPVVTGKTTTLNDIPVGTTFRGTVESDVRNVWITGLFLKARDAVNLSTIVKGGPAATQVVVIQLDERNPHPAVTGHRVWFTCQSVKNYVPVELNVIVEELSK